MAAQADGIEATETDFAALNRKTLEACSDVPSWLAAAKEHPNAVMSVDSSSVNEDQLESYCGSKDLGTPVCRDAIQREILADPDEAATGPTDRTVVAERLAAAGLEVCKESAMPIPNDGYGYDESFTLWLTSLDGTCHMTISDMEAEPSHGFLSVESFSSDTRRNEGARVHAEELVTGAARGDYNPAKVMWSYGSYLVILEDSSTPDVERVVVQAMAEVDGAEKLYASPRALDPTE